MKMNTKGFTLIELMIVVAIIGILAAVAIPGFMKYIKDSKTAEAETNLKAIVDGSMSYFQAEHCFDAACMAPTNQLYPGVPSGGKYAATTAAAAVPAAMGAVGVKNDPTLEATVKLLKAEPWVSIKFSINKPFYYQYKYMSTGAAAGESGFQASAQASLSAANDSTFIVSGFADGTVGNIIDRSLETTDAYTPNPLATKPTT